MSGKNLTLMLVPHSNERARRITISKFVVRAFLLMILMFVVAFIYLSYRNITFTLDRIAYEKLVVDNQILVDEFSESRADIQADIKKVRETLQHLMEDDNRIRVIADLDPIADQIRMMGIGGPDYSQEDPNWSIRKEHGMDAIRNGLDALIVQAEFQKASFEEILDKMLKDREVWDCTPSIIPVKNPIITSGFGMRRHPLTGRITAHNGVDFAGPSGTPIYATADGVVSFEGRKSGFGLVIIIDHGYGYKTAYAHNSINLVAEGDVIKRGGLIARIGATGRTTGPHLHYEVHVNNVPNDPLKYIITDDMNSF
ncbi:MAG: hypothetical protein B6244_07305 [Candidatus Cloacimonetes bacterium 4572_55]|nr:MAG: hypothetical protein B6244_07305 [Candidatus Cloacimonetes bacterium 4572_55]